MFDYDDVSLIAVAHGHGSAITAGLSTPDGATVITGADDGSIFLWDSTMTGCALETVESLRK